MLTNIGFRYKSQEDIIYIKLSEIQKRSHLFFNNAKSIEKRKEQGKLFHLDHHPSNKQILLLLKKKTYELINDESS